MLILPTRTELQLCVLQRSVGHEPIVMLLITKEADVNIATKRGLTALHNAAGKTAMQKMDQSKATHPPKENL
jgi:hypothetical protein